MICDTCLHLNIETGRCDVYIRIPRKDKKVCEFYIDKVVC